MCVDRYFGMLDVYGCVSTNTSVYECMCEELGCVCRWSSFIKHIYSRVYVCCSHTLQAINIILFVHKSLQPLIGGQSTLPTRAVIILHG